MTSVTKEYEKENKEPNSIKNRLNRLGNLYADRTISSPISRNEDNFCIEDNVGKDQKSHRSAKNEARLARLAALAEEINNWEDDLNRPKIVPDSVSNKNKRAPQKQFAWDQKIINTLESQGFTKSESYEHLIYDYKNKLKNKSSVRTPIVHKTNEPVPNIPKQSLTVKSPSPIKAPRIIEELTKVHTKRNEDVPPAALVLSPVKEKVAIFNKIQNISGVPSKSSPNKRVGSPIRSTVDTPLKKIVKEIPQNVLTMAANYEEKTSPQKKIKDPAELTLKERKALFEKNKGDVILPKVPFGTPLPKVRENYQGGKRSEYRPSNFIQESVETSKKFIPANTDPGALSNKVKLEKLEREKELDIIRNRWQTKKNEFIDNELDEISDELFPEQRNTTPIPPPLPFDSVVPIPPPMPLLNRMDSSPRKRLSYPGLSEVKKLKLSPRKEGRLYPSVSDLETDSQDDYDDTESVASFGKEIVLKTRKSNNYDSSKERQVLKDMDDMLESLETDDREISSELSSSIHDIEDEKFCDDDLQFSSEEENNKNIIPITTQTNVIDLPNETNKKLVHSISMYRKQKTLTTVTTTTIMSPSKDSCSNITNNSNNDSNVIPKIVRNPICNVAPVNKVDDSKAVSDKIHELLTEISKQQTIISQASQALNLCTSTVEFSGSTEQIEAERLLLIATQYRQALNHEVQRLRVEKCLNNGMNNITIEEIRVPLKTDMINRMARDGQTYFIMCLARSGAQILSTELLKADKLVKIAGSTVAIFSKQLNLKNLSTNPPFTVTVEVYLMQAKSYEAVPHHLKYHLALPGSAKKEKIKLTPKKGSKTETKLLNAGIIQSPGGPNAVRTSSFQINGFCLFSVKEMNKINFTLNNLTYNTVLEGSLQIKMSSEMKLDVEHRGFLTMYEDYGALVRRWCLLFNDKISYWRYPDDERRKIPIGTIDLSQCSTVEANLAPREICSRPNTFLIETVQPLAESSNFKGETLVYRLHPNRQLVITRHLLSADLREERMEWCDKINKCLSALRAWGMVPTFN